MSAPVTRGDLRPGAVITIYEDPWTRLRPEGEAELIREEIRDDCDEQDYWLVRFLEDPKDAMFYRWIRVAEDL